MSTCGIGGYGGPLPGDPSNNSVLSAVPAFGGIEVSWTYPSTNPHAVSYTKLYRGVSSIFENAVLYREVGGGGYFDQIETATRYYYWIQFVSINGTVGELIGPASAIARPAIGAVIEGLTAQIDAGLLATELRAEIDKITLLRNDLQNEVFDRETGQTSLAQAIADAQAGIAEAHTFIFNESTSRTDADSAMAEQLSGIVATLEDQIAAIQTVSQVDIDNLTNSVNAVQQTQVIASGRLTTVEGQTSALAGVQTTMQSSINGLTNSVNAMSQDVVQVETDLGNIAQVQTSMTASINGVTGTVNSMYTAKVNVNGLVGGFGLANNGTQVEAGFDVDTFWIGRTSSNKRKPFIVSGGIVYIDQAAIPTLTADKINGYNLKVMSGAYTGPSWPAAGQSGFYLGSGGLMMGSIYSGQYALITDTGEVYMPGFSVINGNATFSGHLSAATGSFAGSLSAATGSFAGSLSAATGTFSGSLTAAAVNAVNTINIAGNSVSASASASGTAGTISTTVSVPSGETFRVTGIGLQTGTANGGGSTNSPGFNTLTLSAPTGSVSVVVAPSVIGVTGVDNSPLWGYQSTTIAAQTDLGPGTHTISVTGVSGLSKTLLVLITKR